MNEIRHLYEKRCFLGYRTDHRNLKQEVAEKDQCKEDLKVNEKDGPASCLPKKKAFKQK